MSRKRSNRTRLAATGVGKRKAFLIIGLVFSLVIASGALAQWAGFFVIKQGKSSDPAAVTTQSLSPNSPSKEYVYAGSRLIATEEPASTPGCSYSIAPTSQSFPSNGGAGSVSVTAGSGCNWTASSNDTWLHITSGASGSGNGSVGYSADANTGAQRTGTMTVAGQTFTVNQSAGSSCSYSISPTGGTIGASGGQSSISVIAGAGCSWTAQSNVTWITITAGGSGSGNGTVSYQVASNTGAARSGTMTIAGQTFTLNQSAAGGPPAPTNLTAVALSATSIRIDWSFVADGISVFKIERKTGTSGTYSQITQADTSARSFTDTKRVTHTTYCYRVRAYNGQNGPYSNEACATTP